MIRARISIVSTALFLAVTGVMLISATCFSQNLPTNWEVKYVNLKDDLRALAIDPLDPQVIYLGSDLAVISSSDGGETWTSGQSFRNNKVPISAADSPEAQEILLLIEETGGSAGPAKKSSGGTGGESIEVQLQKEAVAEDVSDAKSDLEEKQTAVEVAGEEEKDQEAQLKEAEAAVTTAEKALKDAESALALWTPDTLTAGDVDGLTYDSDSHMANADYAKLESWLSERGLSVPADPHERQDILTAYLNDHQTEGTAFNDAVAAAQDELDEAKQLEKDLETTASAAKRSEERRVGKECRSRWSPYH